jgi:hypothetical protein
MLLVGTDRELTDLDAERRLVEGRVTWLAGRESDVVVLVDHQRVVRIQPDGTAGVVGQLDTADGQSLVVLPGGEPVVGRRGARLVRRRGDSWEPLRGFDDVPGRRHWENPAGPEPDARSLAVGAWGRLWVNVHVGGLWFSDDVGNTWRQAIEPRADVHEVVADSEGRVAAAAAIGFGWSIDGGETWSWTDEGLHGSYSRAVAIDGDTVLVSSSTGPFTRQAAVYRATLGEPFERCERGLPDWFASNVDSGSLALSGRRAAIGTTEGAVYTSADGGVTWNVAAKGLDPVRAVDLR